MAVDISCQICCEKLDERDVVKENISCWRCGWKKKYSSPINSYPTSQDYDDDWEINYLNIWLPHD